MLLPLHHRVIILCYIFGIIILIIFCLLPSTRDFRSSNASCAVAALHTQYCVLLCLIASYCLLLRPIASYCAKYKQDASCAVAVSCTRRHLVLIRTKPSPFAPHHLFILALYCMALYGIVLYIVMYCIIYIVLYCIVLYQIISHHFSSLGDGPTRYPAIKWP